MPEVVVDIYRVGRRWTWRIRAGTDDNLIIRAQSPRSFRNEHLASEDFNNFRTILASSQPLILS